MKDYRVDLDAYNGPLDLLLFLIRREEVDIYDIPIARVAQQYGQYVEVLSILDPNLAGDFLVMMATLMEIKSRALLPKTLAVDDEDEFDDPRLELVRQLLAYKTFKDAARQLGTAAEVQALRFCRQPADWPVESGGLDLDDVSIWALVNAFSELLEQTGRAKPTHDVVLDETPLLLHADDIIDSLQRGGGSLIFIAIFQGRTKIEMIGLFLALLELIRRRRIRVTQDRADGPITIHLVDATPLSQFVHEFENAGEFRSPPITEGSETDSDDPANPVDESAESRMNQGPTRTMVDDNTSEPDRPADETNEEVSP